jgi:TRAP-type C4-dicarboxylate transport system permease small subunit
MPAAWGEPIARLDAAWQKLEARLCAGVLVVEIAALTLWIGLNGLAKDYTPGQNGGGLVFRGLVTAAVLGSVVHLTTRRLKENVRAAATTVAVIVGLLAGRLWAHAGVHYASNALNWLQNASVLMLIGGLRGLVTRLTLWVALLGASLATSRGKHIHVDVILRFVPAVARRPTAIVSQLAAALVCAFAVVGFVDHIAIAQYRASAVHPCPGDASRSCDTSASERLAAVREGISADLFLLGRQASLDVSTLPRVLVGTPYDRWMTAAEWNAWLDGADWDAHFKKSAVDALHMNAPTLRPRSGGAGDVPSAAGATATPQVSAPGTGEQAPGLLIRELNFVFPFGLAVIALKLLVRILLTLAGRVSVDPEAAHEEEELAQKGDDGTSHVPEAGT